MGQNNDDGEDGGLRYLIYTLYCCFYFELIVGYAIKRIYQQYVSLEFESVYVVDKVIMYAKRI